MILTPILTDHSPVLFSFSKGNECLRGKGFWKYNSSLIKDQNYITEIKKLSRILCTANESLYNCQLKWELLKYEFQKSIINYMKEIAKVKRQQRTNLEDQLKILNKCLDEDDNLSKYHAIKNELDAFYDHIAEGIRIRSKCDWYDITKNQQNYFWI